MRKANRALCILLTVVSMLSWIPLSAGADETPETAGAANRVTLLDETFDNFDTPDWSGYMNPDKISWGITGGCAALTDTGWSALRIVNASALEGISKYTVSLDVQLAALPGNATMLFGLVYENDEANSSVGVDSGLFLIRSNNGGAPYLLHGGYRSTTAKYLQTNGTLSGGAGNAANFPQLSAFHEGDPTKTWIRISLSVDRDGRTCTASVDSKVVNTYTDFSVQNSGLYLLLQQNKGTKIDNVLVTDDSGNTLYAEPCDGSAPELPQEAGSNPLTQLLTENAMRLTDAGWGIWELATAEQLKGATAFTLSATIRLDSAKAGSQILAFRLNQSGDAPKNNINGATVIQLWKMADDISLIGGNRSSGGWVTSGDGAKTEISIGKTVQLQTAFHLELTVDQIARTCTVILTCGENRQEVTFSNITDAESNLSLVLEKQSSLWDDLKLEATYADPIDLLGVQVTEAVGETYGLRFSARLRTAAPEQFCRVGMKIVVTYADESREYIGKTCEVWRSIKGKTNGTETVIGALDCGANALFCVTLAEIPTGLGAVTFTVTPFAETADGTTVWYAPGTVTVADGVITK